MPVRSEARERPGDERPWISGRAVEHEKYAKDTGRSLGRGARCECSTLLRRTGDCNCGNTSANHGRLHAHADQMGTSRLLLQVSFPHHSHPHSPKSYLMGLQLLL